MKKNTVAIILFVLFLLIVKFAVKPFLNRRAAVKVVETVLDQWSNKDLLKAIDQWDDPEKYPPVYNVQSFFITNKEFNEVDNMLYAKIRVMIDFEPGNLLPNGEYWSFILKDGRFGWKITDFYIENPSAIPKPKDAPPTPAAFEPIKFPKIEAEDAPKPSVLRPSSTRPIKVIELNSQ